MIRIVIVEDDAQIREGLSYLIQNSPGFCCSGCYGEAELFLENIRTDQPDVVLMDIGLPGMSGIECVTRLKADFPGIQVIMLTVYDDDQAIFNSLQAGSTGYLLKKTPPVKLLEAIDDVYKGGSPMSSSIARQVVNAFNRPASAKSGVEELSTREMEILDFLSRGFLYKEIAKELFISIETVRTHIHHIYEKLHVRSRTEAAVKFLKK